MLLANGDIPAPASLSSQKSTVAADTMLSRADVQIAYLEVRRWHGSHFRTCRDKIIDLPAFA